MSALQLISYSVEYHGTYMVGITESIQTGKSMGRYDNGTIQKHIHCLISDARTNWKASWFCQISFSLLENFIYVNLIYIVRIRRFLSVISPALFY